MKFDNLLAGRTGRMRASAIREILKVASAPGMVSLAGGIPAPESFPLSIIEELVHSALARYGAGALQYDLTEGFPPLREALVTVLRDRGIAVKASDIYVTSGSQGVLDGIAKILISPNDAIAVEAPTYLGALQAFNAYEPRYVRMDTDDDGLIPESLERVLATGNVKFVYLVPTFQNPTGRTIPLARRKRIAEIAIAHRTLIVEDDPYSELRYRGENLPPIHTFAPENVLYASTLSKVFAPGLRIGFYVAPSPIDRWLVLAKQGVDLHTATFNQALAAEYITGGHLARQIPAIINLYRPRQEALISALAEFLPDGFHWSRPDGGMFVWVEGPNGVDTEAAYSRAVERKVAYVPGKFFFTEPDEGRATMRLNFTSAEPAALRGAVQTLGNVLSECV